jgi:hypothetical protein
LAHQWAIINVGYFIRVLVLLLLNELQAFAGKVIYPDSDAQNTKGDGGKKVTNLLGQAVSSGKTISKLNHSQLKNRPSFSYSPAKGATCLHGQALRSCMFKLKRDPVKD